MARLAHQGNQRMASASFFGEDALLNFREQNWHVPHLRSRPFRADAYLEPRAIDLYAFQLVSRLTIPVSVHVISLNYFITPG